MCDISGRRAGDSDETIGRRARPPRTTGCKEKSMISQRQIEFRREYRSRIMGWYDGYFHIAIIYAIGAAAFYIYVQHIHGVTVLEWLTVPLTFLFTNLFECGVHQYLIPPPVH